MSKKNQNDFKGTIGMLLLPEKDLSEADGNLKKAIAWLKQNNNLYKTQTYVPNYELITSYTVTTVDGLHSGFPAKTPSDPQLSIQNYVNIDLKKPGLMLPVDNYQTPANPDFREKIIVGQSICSDPSNSNKREYLYFDSPDIEGFQLIRFKLFL